jgi:phosphatidylinositol glycan class B
MPAPQPTTSKTGRLLYPWRHEWPRYLVLFGHLLKQEGVKTLLEEKGYKEVWKAGREWEGEGNRSGAVRVWQWLPQSTPYE